MIEQVQAPAPNPPSSSAVSRRSVLRRFGPFVAFIIAGVAALAAISLLTRTSNELMDPTGTGPGGGGALAAVLEQQGVSVSVQRSAKSVVEAVADSEQEVTLFVANDRFLGPDASVELTKVFAQVDHLVLLAPGQNVLQDLGIDGISVTPANVQAEFRSECRIDEVRDDESLFDLASKFDPESTGDDGIQTCFPLRSESSAAGSGYGLVQLEATPARAKTTLLGSGAGFSNESITEADNAAIALRLLGQSPRLLWYQPQLTELGTQDQGGGEAQPPIWIAPMMLLVAIAIIALALVRGRRLGALVPEALPVVVRARETTDSRARLYHRAGDRERAAAALRVGTIDRIRAHLALPRGSDLDAVIRTSAPASSRSPVEVAALLDGPTPGDDAALVQLAQDLSDLERRIRHD